MENIVTAPKTDMFRFRINPEIRKQVEEVYAKNGLISREDRSSANFLAVAPTGVVPSFS